MSKKLQQLRLNLVETAGTQDSEGGRIVPTDGLGNKLGPDDQDFHDWYRFVLSYPPHLVSHYIQDFKLSPDNIILDPFCGTGTTLVEAKCQGFAAIGLEANPVAHFASQVKLDWEVNPDELLATAMEIAHQVQEIFKAQGIDDTGLSKPSSLSVSLRSLSPECEKLILTNSISPFPLHKSLILIEILDGYRQNRCYRHLKLAFAKTLVHSISNLHFGPEVGVGKLKQDTPVVAAWFAEVENMAKDLRKIVGISYPPANVFLADAREIGQILGPCSVDAVITSPPYPNEKDYTRTTRLESVLLGFIQNKEDLRALKKNLVRSNTRGVYKDDDDDKFVARHKEIQEIADAIEQRRIVLKKISGFERLYARVTKLYFGGMAKHLLALQPILRPGAQLAYVVGDQASYLRVMIRTGQLLAEIAESVGYEVVRIDLFRKRFATPRDKSFERKWLYYAGKGKLNVHSQKKPEPI